MAFLLTERSVLAPAWSASSIAICLIFWMSLIGLGVATASPAELGYTIMWTGLCAILLAAPYLLLVGLTLNRRVRSAIALAIAFALSFWWTDWGFVRFWPMEALGITDTDSGFLIADALVRSFRELEFFAALSTTLCLMSGLLGQWKRGFVGHFCDIFAACVVVAWLFLFWSIHSTIEAAAAAATAVIGIVSFEVFIRLRPAAINEH